MSARPGRRERFVLAVARAQGREAKVAVTSRSIALSIVAVAVMAAGRAFAGECVADYTRADFDAAVARSRVDSAYTPQFEHLACWEEPESTLADMIIDVLVDTTVSRSMRLTSLHLAKDLAVPGVWPTIEVHLDDSDLELREVAWWAVAAILRHGRGPLPTEMRKIDWLTTYMEIHGPQRAPLTRECALQESPSETAIHLRTLPAGTVVVVTDYDAGWYEVGNGAGTAFVDERCIRSTVALSMVRSLSFSTRRTH
jgi:hypothetical protein